MVCINKKTKVMVVLGARREAIKAAPIIDRLRRRTSDFEPIVVAIPHSLEVFDPVLNPFDIVPDIVFNLTHIRQGLPSLTSHVMENLTIALERTRPDIVLTEGNSPPAFACSLAAFNQKISVALIASHTGHHLSDQPVPEDVNRRLTTVLAEMHFAPTRMSRHCLIKEGARETKIAVTGNPLIDAFKHLSAQPFTFRSDALQRIACEKKRMILFAISDTNTAGENWRASLGAALALVQAFADLEIIFTSSHPQEAPGASQNIRPETDRLHWIHAADEMTFVNLLKNAYVIVTDSHALPEEASLFQKPVLILENGVRKTPGVYTVSCKTVERAPAAIVRETAFLLNNDKAYRKMQDMENPYGDGLASERIVTAIQRWSKNRQRLLIPAEEFSPRTPLTDLLCQNL